MSEVGAEKTIIVGGVASLYNGPFVHRGNFAMCRITCRITISRALVAHGSTQKPSNLTETADCCQLRDALREQVGRISGASEEGSLLVSQCGVPIGMGFWVRILDLCEETRSNATASRLYSDRRRSPECGTFGLDLLCM